MQYIITAKNIQDNPSVTDPTKRTEIATELISTRMKVLKMLHAGEINEKLVTIVTKKDRFCLYENIFSNLMDWNYFQNMTSFLDGIHPEDTVLDLVSEICDGSIDSSEAFSVFLPMVDSVKNIAMCELKNHPKPFVAILIRGAANNSEKNISEDYWYKLIATILDNSDLDIFVFGETEGTVLGLRFIFKNRLHEVNTFKGWCSLLSNPNCKRVISPCSGGVYPVFFVGQRNLQLSIIDQNRYSLEHANSPSFYHDCVNLKDIRVEKFFYLPGAEILAGLIKEESK